MQEISKRKLKELAKLKQKKYREIHQKTIIEGYRLIKQLLESGVKLEELFIAESYVKKLPNLSAKKIYLLKDYQFQKISTVKNPQLIAATVLTKTKKISKNNLILYLDGISNPGNLGTIFRTAYAFNIDGIVLSPNCCEIFNPKVIRSSLGSVLLQPAEIHDYEWFNSIKARIIAADAKAEKPLSCLSAKDKNYVIVIGSEAHGYSPEIKKIVQDRVKIPLINDMESLNAAVSAAIIMYEFRRKN